MARPIIALLTDFGTRDHYAGAMKGVALGICPDVDAGRYLARRRPRTTCSAARSSSPRSYRYFPAGTIFLVVVDPGVGSTRRGIAAESGDYRFVAPDNGVLTAVLDEHPAKRVVELTERKYARPDRQPHVRRARSVCAGGRLAGARGSTSPRSADPPARFSASTSRGRRSTTARIDGEVLRVDRFGNLITNIDRRTFDKLAGGPLDIRIGTHQVSRVVSTYADASPARSARCSAARDHLEIAANGANAADALDLESRRAGARRPPRVIRFRAP